MACGSTSRVGIAPFCIAIVEPDEVPPQKRRLEGGQAGQGPFSPCPTNPATATAGRCAGTPKTRAGLSPCPTGKAFSILASPASASSEKGKFPAARMAATLISSANTSGTDNLARRLHRLRVKLKATATADIGMDHIAFVPQRADIAQHGPAGGTDLFGQRINGGCAVAAKAAHDGVMSESYVHIGTLAQMVTIFWHYFDLHRFQQLQNKEIATWNGQQ